MHDRPDPSFLTYADRGRPAQALRPGGLGHGAPAGGERGRPVTCVAPDEPPSAPAQAHVRVDRAPDVPRDASTARRTQAQLGKLAGLRSALHEIIVERLPPELVAELDEAALTRQRVKDCAAAERRRQKEVKRTAAAPAPVPQPSTAGLPGLRAPPEVVVRRPHAGGGGP